MKVGLHCFDNGIMLGVFLSPTMERGDGSEVSIAKVNSLLYGGIWER